MILGRRFFVNPVGQVRVTPDMREDDWDAIRNELSFDVAEFRGATLRGESECVVVSSFRREP